MVGVDYSAIEALRERHAAWRLLRAGNGSLILSFLGEFFVEANRGACPAGEIASALDDQLYALNHPSPDGEVRYPREPRQYLEDWAAPEAGYLRRFYPAGDDEVHYEITPAFAKAYAWVTSLQERSFVGTESRLHTVVDLLRQIAHGTEADPEARLLELRRRRAELDAEIEAVESGDVAVLDESGVRDRYQQLSATARELLSDFREVEENFRRLDRASRERIAGWQGSKGELLAELIESRSEISGTDQGRSFQAFYEFLLSQARQDELAALLAKVSALEAVTDDARIRGIHHDWAEAAERAQRTVRQISEQLRRFLDDQVWLENRRVLDIVREVESAALRVRTLPPSFGLELDEIGIDIGLPFERPLYQAPIRVDVDSEVTAAGEEADAELLFAQSYVDRARLLGNIRNSLPAGTSALLSDIVELNPIEQGAAEIVGYLALEDEDITIELDDTAETLLHYEAEELGTARVARLPRATVTWR